MCETIYEKKQKIKWEEQRKKKLKEVEDG